VTASAGSTSVLRADEELRDGLHARLSRQLRDPALAEDIGHDVFLRIHERADQLRDVDQVRGWIHRIARNAMVDALRRRRPEVEVPDTLAQDEPDDDGTQLAVQAALRSMMDRLPPADAEALRAVEWEGRTQTDLADEWGVSVSGAKSRVQRARGKLRDLLLDCCHFELDARGRVTDMIPRSRDECACHGGNC